LSNEEKTDVSDDDSNNNENNSGGNTLNSVNTENFPKHISDLNPYFSASFQPPSSSFTSPPYRVYPLYQKSTLFLSHFGLLDSSLFEILPNLVTPPPPTFKNASPNYTPISLVSNSFAGVTAYSPSSGSNADTIRSLTPLVEDVKLDRKLKHFSDLNEFYFLFLFFFFVIVYIRCL
jgi:hypothetical protein